MYPFILVFFNFVHQYFIIISIQCFWVFVVVVKFIPKYFILFDAVVNAIVYKFC